MHFSTGFSIINTNCYFAIFAMMNDFGTIKRRTHSIELEKLDQVDLLISLDPRPFAPESNYHFQKQLSNPTLSQRKTVDN